MDAPRTIKNLKGSSMKVLKKIYWKKVIKDCNNVFLLDAINVNDAEDWMKIDDKLLWEFFSSSPSLYCCLSKNWRLIQ